MSQPAPFATRKGREQSDRGMSREGAGVSLSAECWRFACTACGVLVSSTRHIPSTYFACARPFHLAKGAGTPLRIGD